MARMSASKMLKRNGQKKAAPVFGTGSGTNYERSDVLTGLFSFPFICQLSAHSLLSIAHFARACVHYCISPSFRGLPIFFATSAEK